MLPHRVIEAFRKTPNAWTFCDKILQDSALSVAVTHWAASTMEHKMRYDFRDLPASCYMSLRDSLMTYTLRLSASPSYSPVVSSLAGSLATLALQMPQKMWPDPVTDLSGLPQTGVALAVLRMFPEACTSSRVRVANQRRIEFARYLDSKISLVFGLLLNVLMKGDASLAKPALQCLNNWLISCSVTPEHLRDSPLVVAIYQAVEQPTLSEVAADCAVSLIRNVCSKPDDPIAHFVLERVSALGTLYQNALAAGKSDICLNISRIFAETGECFAEYLSEGRPEAIVLSNVLLHATSLSSFDTDNLSYDFFHEVAKQIAISLPEERALRAEKFVPIYQGFARIILEKMLLPDDYEDMTEDEKEEVRAFRHYELTQGIRDCNIILGTEPVLTLIFGVLSDQCTKFAAGATDWRGIEAAMYAVRVLARCISSSDKSEILPRILQLIPSLPPAPMVQYTSILVVGRYSEWLRKNPEKLTPMLQYVISSLPVRERQSAAALAFQHICSSCSPELAPNVEQLIAMYEQSSSINLQPEDSDEILRGISRVICVLTLDRARGALERICAPPAGFLKSFVPQLATLTAASSSATVAWVKPVINAFHVIGSLFRYVNFGETLPRDVVHPVLGVMEAMWPVIVEPFFAAIRVLPDDVVYELCRFCRCTVMACDKFLIPMMGTLLNTVTLAYKAKLHPDLLFLVNELVHTLGLNSACDVPFISAYASISETTFAALPNPDSIAEYPSLVKEFFDLGTICIERLALTLLGSRQYVQLLSNSLAYAAHVLPITHNSAEGVRSVLKFISRFVTAGKKEKLVDATSMVLTNVGIPLVHSMICCIGGCQPISMYVDIRSALMAMKRFNQSAIITWLCMALSIPLPPTVTPSLIPAAPYTPAPFPFTVDRSVSELFIQELVSAPRESTATESIELFGNECRRGWTSSDPIS